MKSEKKIMLIYNTGGDEGLLLKAEDVSADWFITADRRYFQQADVIVFYLPDLLQTLEHSMEKPPGQLWVAWYMESEKKYPGFRSPEIGAIFDLRISYRQNADVVFPFYRYEYADLFLQKDAAQHKQSNNCVFVSGGIHSEGRRQYLKELMRHTKIDFYGMLYNNKQTPTDHQIETERKIFRKYKFVLAFEDVIDRDYVTGKFFDPLLAGSVPIYFGAPNISDFAPGDNCFVDVRQFENPRSLAHFINTSYDDAQLYATFFEWKSRPLRPSFLRKTAMQKEHPFVRLCRKVEEKMCLSK